MTSKLTVLSLVERDALLTTSISRARSVIISKGNCNKEILKKIEMEEHEEDDQNLERLSVSLN